ncbi:PPC domain-containing DNA-binding protein [Verrucomicrobiota bacterium]
MKYSEAEFGRVFIIRLEDGDIIHEKIEGFAREKNIKAAALIALGCADAGSRIIVGPEKARSTPINPMELVLDDVHETTGMGTIFPDADGNPVLHMHMACGRKESTKTGCVRSGVKVWHVVEIVLFELTGSTAKRLHESETGFELLAP